MCSASIEIILKSAWRQYPLRSCARYRLDKEIREYNVFGLGVALDMIPIITCDSELAPDMYTEDTINTADEPSKEPYPVMTTNILCRKMIADLVKELVDNGCLT